jgi:hypothetical protein
MDKEKPKDDTDWLDEVEDIKASDLQCSLYEECEACGV